MQDRADLMFEETIAIADENEGDDLVIVRKDGTEVKKVNRDVIERARLRVDTRKWALARMNPKKYGDRAAIDVAGGITLDMAVKESLKYIGQKKVEE